MKITISRVNGVGAVRNEIGHWEIPMAVLVRNVMDMLEGNEKYGNLSFCEAQQVTDMATIDELALIYAEMLPVEKIEEIMKR